MDTPLYRFVFDDGTEALAHYGVKGMKWDKHLKAQDPAYLQALGMGTSIPEAFQKTASDVQSGTQKVGQGINDIASGVSRGVDQVRRGGIGALPQGVSTATRGISTGAKKVSDGAYQAAKGLDHPVHAVNDKLVTSHQRDGSSAAARQRLIDRYSTGKVNPAPSVKKTLGASTKIQSALQKAKANGMLPADKNQKTPLLKQKTNPVQQQNKALKEAKASNVAKKAYGFDPSDYGYRRTKEGAKAAIAEAFGEKAARGKMSREAALAKATNAQERALANTFKPGKKLRQEAKQEKDYRRETSDNRIQLAGDSKAIKEAQAKTDAAFGKKGKAEQAAELHRRRMRIDKEEKFMRDNNYVRTKNPDNPKGIIFRRGTDVAKEAAAKRLKSDTAERRRNEATKSWHEQVSNNKLNRHRAQDYKNEKSLNADEFKGDAKGLKRANEQTDAYYGKKGKQAQAVESQRRRKSREDIERTMRQHDAKKAAEKRAKSDTAERRRNEATKSWHEKVQKAKQERAERKRKQEAQRRKWDQATDSYVERERARRNQKR